MTLIFVDTETTGLDPAKGHRPWEIALIIRGHDNPDYDGEWLIQQKVDLKAADAMSLQIGGYYPRAVKAFASLVVVSAPPKGYTAIEQKVEYRDLHPRRLAQLLDGATLVASAPAFDAAMLKASLEDYGHYATWSHRLLDVRAMTVGLLLGEGDPESNVLHLSSDALARQVGCLPAEDFERHTAMGDARWVERWYDALVNYSDQPVRGQE